MNLRSFFATCIGLCLVSACSYRIVPDEFPEFISYKKHIQAVLEINCVSCHHRNNTELNLQGFEAYEMLMENYIQAGSSEESIFYLKLEEGHPFEGALSDYEMGLIKKWIEDGAEK